MSGSLLAVDYLGPDTFDVAAKTMYARDLLSGPGHRWSWPRQVYWQHLKLWNEFCEGQKECFPDFVGAFTGVLGAMRDGTFDWARSPIPTTPEGKLTNGRHRLASALVLDQHIRTVVAEEPCNCSAEDLRGLGLNSWMLDSMAIEFCRLKPESRIAVVFGDHDRSELMNALEIDVAYVKETEVSGPGPLNLVHELYHGEEWLPVNGRTKAAMCYSSGAGRLTLYVLDVRVSDFDVRVAKEQARRAIGWNRIHINDTHAETMRIARALLNDNGIHFLNHARPSAHKPVRHARDVSIDSGGVLEAYGLRPAADIDFVDEDMHLEFHGVPLDTLLQDPRNFFWSAGYKYASIPAVRRMKQNRGEPKDKRDLLLMEGL